MPAQQQQSSPAVSVLSNVSEIEMIDSSGTTNNPQQAQTSTSWVWQYFKRETTDGTTWHVCQASKIPKGSAICLAKIKPDKQGSTKSMMNHLLNKHGIKKDNARELGSLVNFLTKKKNISMDKLDRESLLCAVGQYVV
jgi:hypothetical protein